MGIRQQFTRPGCQWMNGRIERLFGTLKAVLKSSPFTDRIHLDEILWKFLWFYNEIRPHSALHGATPDEAWRG
ncbi:MAG: integrase core domain-containing protein, partial [Zoogloeaceae bacterium]|nr:integrase core domain-containing protein [Zoogloeaceae bacterium]